jgi:hypothetical protein
LSGTDRGDGDSLIKEGRIHHCKNCGDKTYSPNSADVVTPCSNDNGHDWVLYDQSLQTDSDQEGQR